MFTVILLSETAREIFEPVEIYFDPFVEAGLIAFGHWNESLSALTMKEVVPDLPELIKGKAQWRALVVDHPRGEIRTPPDQEREIDNPFDFCDDKNTTLKFEDSKHPLIRLAHVLLGYPQMTAKKFVPAFSYDDPNTGKRLETELAEAVADYARPRASGTHGSPETEALSTEKIAWSISRQLKEKYENVRRIFREEAYSDEEKQKHEELVRRYDMKEVRPSEVTFVATRPEIKEDEKDALKRAWNTDIEQNASRFVVRNDYPPMTRFAVYELLEQENSGYEQDLLRFWLSILALAINAIPPGGFQADRLYRLGIEFANDGLAEMFNMYVSDLAMVRDHLTRIINTPRNAPEMNLKDLLGEISVNVDVYDLGGEGLKTSDAGYGLVSDLPSAEYQRWRAQVSEVEKQADQFMRKPRRVAARAVAKARRKAADEEPTWGTPNELEREELSEELAKRLPSLVVPETLGLVHSHRIKKTMNQRGAEIRRFMSQRMNTDSAVLGVGVTWGIWVAVFIPYLIQSFDRNSGAFGRAAVLLLGIIAVMALAGLAVLLTSQLKLPRFISDFNRSIRKSVSEVSLL